MAILELTRTASLDVADIVAIRIAIPPMHVPTIDRSSVSTRLDAITSMQYQVGPAFLRPEDLFDLERQPCVDREMSELMSRVNVRGEDSHLDGFHERSGASIEIITDE